MYTKTIMKTLRLYIYLKYGRNSCKYGRKKIKISKNILINYQNAILD